MSNPFFFLEVKKTMTEINPMLAQTAKEVPNPEDYIAELKYDGARAIPVFNHGFNLYNRRGIDITNRFPELHENNGLEAVLDGEIIIGEGSKKDFQLLQPRIHLQNELRIRMLAKRNPVNFVVFDVLEFRGEDVTKEPLEERKRLVVESVMQISRHNPQYKISAYADYNECIKVPDEYEGLMLKRKNSLYQSGRRSRDWLKLKTTKTIDCVILGYTKGEGRRSQQNMFGALVLGCYNGNQLNYVGKVGTGLSNAKIQRIKSMLIESGPHKGEEA